MLKAIPENILHKLPPASIEIYEKMFYWLEKKMF